MKELKFDETLVCKKCDFLGAKAKDEITTLVMPMEIWRYWKLATKVYPQLEIMGLFKVNEQGVITELDIPKQEIESASCTLLEQLGHYDGSIHSHHSMGASFSTMDDSTVLPNYRFNIVTNHRDDSEASERVDLPCGGIGFKPLKVALEGYADDADIEALVKARCETPAQRSVVVTPVVHTHVPGFTSYHTPGTVDSSRYHPGSCTCVMCTEKRKESKAYCEHGVTTGTHCVNCYNSAGNGADTTVPFSRTTTGVDGLVIESLAGRRVFTEALPSKRNGTSKGEHRRTRRARNRSYNGKGAHWDDQLDLPNVVTCTGANCVKLIYTHVEDYGSDAMGNILCPKCWERMYEEAYGGFSG